MRKVLIVGEVCVDEFVYGKATRLSPEGPVPVFIESHTITNGGMAYNVKENLQALGCETELLSNTQMIIKKRIC